MCQPSSIPLRRATPCNQLLGAPCLEQLSKCPSIHHEAYTWIKAARKGAQETGRSDTQVEAPARWNQINMLNNGWPLPFGQREDNLWIEFLAKFVIAGHFATRENAADVKAVSVWGVGHTSDDHRMERYCDEHGSSPTQDGGLVGRTQANSDRFPVEGCFH